MNAPEATSLQGNLKRPRRTRVSRMSQNFMLESARDSFTGRQPPSEQSSENMLQNVTQMTTSKTIAKGDNSPIADENCGASPSPLKTDISEGLVDEDAPHARMIKGKVLSFHRRNSFCSQVSSSVPKIELIPTDALMKNNNNDISNFEDQQSSSASSSGEADLIDEYEISNCLMVRNQKQRQHHNKRNHNDSRNNLLMQQKSNKQKQQQESNNSQQQSMMSLFKLSHLSAASMPNQLTPSNDHGSKSVRNGKDHARAKLSTTFKEESSEEGIPMPEELSVSQIPLEKSNEILTSCNNSNRSVVNLNGSRSSLLTPATATSSFANDQTSSMHRGSQISGHGVTKTLKTQPMAYVSTGQIMLSTKANSNSFISASNTTYLNNCDVIVSKKAPTLSKPPRAQKPSSRMNIADTTFASRSAKVIQESKQSAVEVKRPTPAIKVLNSQEHGGKDVTLFCDDNVESHDHQEQSKFEPSTPSAAPASPQQYEAPKFKSRESIVCQVDSQSNGFMSPLSIRSNNVKLKISQMQKKHQLTAKKKKQQSPSEKTQQQEKDNQTPDKLYKEVDPVLDQDTSNMSLLVEEANNGDCSLEPQTQLVPESNCQETRMQQRLCMIDSLASTKGNHYQAFKSKPELMSLFDACKSFEEDKSLFSTDGESNSNDNMSSNQDQQEGEEDADIVEADQRQIRPVDPKMLGVSYLGPKGDDVPQYTLVLDLDETLIHYRDNSHQTTEHTQTENDEEIDEIDPHAKKPMPSEDQSSQGNKRLATESDEEVAFFIRPGLSAFLSDLSVHYELVLYTAATRDYADYFLQIIDQKGLFANSKILSREHCQFEGDFAIKDLRLLGRDLRKTIIIDNLKENFERTTPDNGIHICNFEGDFSDEELPKYTKFLTKLATNEEDDVRNVIFDYRDKWDSYE